ncbi:hypothetical protein HDV00_010760 [Rhizophlyctis rosea]|nr:hypothetical protein HDV00_010760 [Rhizophlyctis rosea]
MSSSVAFGLSAKLILISFGNSCLNSIVSSGDQILKFSVKHNQAELVQPVIDDMMASGDSYAFPHYLEPLLTKACKRGYTDVAKVLVRFGGNIQGTSGYFDDPFVNAILGNNLEIVEFLLHAGAYGRLQEALELASEYGLTEIAAHLIEGGADVDGVLHGHSPLSRAIHRGHTEVVRLLLSAGANPSGGLTEAVRADHSEFIPLFLDAQPGDEAITGVFNSAIQFGSIKVAAAMLRAGAHPRMHNLVEAIQMGYSDVACLLLQAGVETNSDVFLSAIFEGLADTIPLFVNAGADVNAGNGYALVLAASQGHWRVVKNLLNAGADPNRSAWGESALEKAVEGGFAKIVSTLLNAGADVHVADEDGNPEEALLVAVSRGDLAIVNLLLKGGADARARGGRILLEAVDAGCADVLKALLDCGGRAVINNNDGIALREAARYGSWDLVNVLLDAGADIHSGNDEVLVQAVRTLNMSRIKWYIKKGANVRARDDEALISAAYRGNVGIIKLLIEAGADVHARSEGALWYAAYWGDTDVVKLLVSVGAMHGRNEDVLVIAAKRSHWDIVQLLWETRNRNHAGLDKILIFAAEDGQWGMVDVLPAADANVNACDGKCLAKAARGGYEDIVRSLLSAGFKTRKGWRRDWQTARQKVI